MTWAALHGEAVELHEHGSTRRARFTAERAVAAAGAPEEEAESRLALAWFCHLLGNPDRARALIAAARPVWRERADALTGVLLCHDGDHAAALPRLEAAVDALVDRPREAANALVALGVATTHLRRFDTAGAALARAQSLYSGLGETGRAATCTHNRGFVAAQTGDFAGALALYTEAGIDGRRHPDAVVDRAMALLGAGLHREANAELTRASALLGATGRAPGYADAVLTQGWCALRAGRPSGARAAVRLAATSSPEALALDAHARLASGEAVPEASTLAEGCQPVVAARLRIAAGRPELVARERFDGAPELRALGWLAQARIASTPRAALTACRIGLTLDPRATELADTGVAVALATGRPRAVFRWVERQRVATTPPRAIWDPVALSKLRTDSSSDWTTPCGVVALERHNAHPARPEEFSEVLTDRAALNFFLHNGRTWAVSIVDHRFRLHDLGSVNDDTVYRAFLLAATTGDSAVARRAAAGLDEAIFANVGKTIGDRPLVVLPSRNLTRLPWAALPSMRGRSVTVAPSAVHWLQAQSATRRRMNQVWVAGPRLDHAESEVVALHRRHGGTLLTGQDATVAAVLAAMADADTLHIAAHCAHRPDAPLFSAIELADGPLFGHDLLRVPDLVVLSACESGLDLPAALLDRGARSVVASTLPVPDARCARLVRDLHDHLADGLDPGAALAAAQLANGDLGFVAFGG
ncbi:CHAT domain-containing protein [Actinokineospora auranticolor]|uniref:CHAT domain-containing protein n=1 Tax=Actinokineospora auranticolor TaxID=155976 RepID=A0A2S6GH36_9PSEU|nr:CHAT domain-containing protein [Actinokineospora auranticolor]